MINILTFNLNQSSFKQNTIANCLRKHLKLHFYIMFKYETQY